MKFRKQSYLISHASLINIHLQSLGITRKEVRLRLGTCKWKTKIYSFFNYKFNYSTSLHVKVQMHMDSKEMLGTIQASLETSIESRVPQMNFLAVALLSGLWSILIDGIGLATDGKITFSNMNVIHKLNCYLARFIFYLFFSNSSFMTMNRALRTEISCVVYSFAAHSQ